MKNNKILIVSRKFPPANGGGVQRIVKFSRYLQQMGWDVTVCTVEGENFSWIDTARLKEVESIKTIRIFEKPYKSRFIDKLLNKLRFYDFYFKWSKRVLSYFEKEKFDYDFVLTSGPPHSVHYIGLKLKEKHRFLWISDFRDPYTLAAFHKPITFLHKKNHIDYEQKIYNKSDLVIANTSTNEELTLKIFNFERRNKITTIYNGYDLEDLKVRGDFFKYQSNKINLVYLGGMRGDRVDGYFYRMLEQVKKSEPDLLKKININIIGDLSRKGNLLESLELNNFFSFYKAIPYNKVGNYIFDADGCLTWQSPDKGYEGTIAGKVFDYFGMKKPIFSLGQRKSELHRIINENNIGIHADVSNLTKAAEDFILFINNLESFNLSYKKMSPSYHSSFNRKNQAEQLNESLLELQGLKK